MFRRLLLKLTVLNASVIAFLFCALIAGAYFYTQNDIHRRSVFFLTRMAAEINAGYQPPFFASPTHTPGKPDVPPPPPLAPPLPVLPVGPPPPPPDGDMPHPVIFYVQTDPSGNISFTSAQQPLSENKLEDLIHVVRNLPASNGQVTFANVSYFYLVTPRADQPGTLFIFQNFEREYNVFRSFMESLAVIGIFCFILSLFGSLFLARKAMRPIRRAWSDQREFLADASHELRTPLAVIQASLDVIRGNREEKVSEQAQWLDNIGESVNSMASLVESLLFLARIDSQQQPIDKKTFALDKAIANAVDLFKPITDAQDIHLDAEIIPNITLLGDEARIKQVLGIILDNAVRHTPSGGKINVMLQQFQHNAQLTITDTGEGISRDHLPKIFDRFYQADPARNTGGAGLGLSIAKCIVEYHGGTIQALSKPGAGATFLIRLPLN